MKIGIVSSKNTLLSLHSLYLHFIFGVGNKEGNSVEGLISTLGNLNISGIEYD
jgi:hypothetical protein